jgi:hypothetical protein
MKSLLLRIYTQLLKLYPKEYRQRFADEMLQVFEDKLEDTRGLHKLLHLGFSTLIDFLGTVLEQRLAKISRTHSINVTSLFLFFTGAFLILRSLGNSLHHPSLPTFLNSSVYFPGILGGIGFQLNLALICLIGFYSSMLTSIAKQFLWISALVTLISSTLAHIVLFRSLHRDYIGYGSLMDMSLLLLLISHGLIVIASFLILKPFNRFLFFAGAGFTTSTLVLLIIQIITKIDSGLGFIMQIGTAISGVAWISLAIYLNTQNQQHTNPT